MNRFIYIFLLIVFSVVVSTGFMQFASAQPINYGFEDTPSGFEDTSDGAGGGIKNPIKADNIEELLKDLLDIIIQIGIPVLVIMFIYTGFLFVKARGNKDEINTAKQALLWTVIGAAIILGAFVISEVIQGTITSLKSD